jgi:hypothetical protein
MRFLTAILGLLLAVPLIQAQEPAKPVPSSAPRASAVSAEDAQFMREDLQRMRSLIYQMQRNLASVSTAQDPLKHQFELEIEMWQLQIASMERRLGTSEEPRK